MLERGFGAVTTRDAARRRRLIREAFSRVAHPYLRVWIEAVDEAAGDRDSRPLHR